jgi:WD40 repeat protein
VSEIGLSRDGKRMFAITSAYWLEGKATGWLLAGDLSRAVQLDHEGGLFGATFSPDGTRLATMSQDGTAHIWNRDGGLDATLPHTGPVLGAAWSSDGRWLATGTTGGTLTLWDGATWQPRKTIEAHGNFISTVAFDERDALIASAGADGVVKLWDVETLLQVARIPTGPFVSQLAFHRDRILVSGAFATQSWRCDRYLPAWPGPVVFTD